MIAWICVAVFGALWVAACVSLDAERKRAASWQQVATTFREVAAASQVNEQILIEVCDVVDLSKKDTRH